MPICLISKPKATSDYLRRPIVFLDLLLSRYNIAKATTRVTIAPHINIFVVIIFYSLPTNKTVLPLLHSQ